MNIIKITNKRLTKDDAAKALGLQTYDTALPQTWLDDLLLKLSLHAEDFPENWKDIVTSGLVWCYKNAKGESSLFGYPVALTVQVMNMLTPLLDFSEQAAVIETRETFVISGSQPVRDVIVADDNNQAEMLFRAKYPGVLITSIQTKEQFNDK
jgi:hypothetical protein